MNNYGLASLTDYPDIEIVMGAGALSGDISGTMRNMLGITDEFFENVYRGIIGEHAFGLVPILMQPRSRGRIKLKSTNPFHWPSMQPNYLEDATDVERLIKGVRIVSKWKMSQCYTTTPTYHLSIYFLGIKSSPIATVCEIRNEIP